MREFFHIILSLIALIILVIVILHLSPAYYLHIEKDNCTIEIEVVEKPFHFQTDPTVEMEEFFSKYSIEDLIKNWSQIAQLFASKFHVRKVSLNEIYCYFQFTSN